MNGAIDIAPFFFVYTISQFDELFFSLLGKKNCKQI